MDIRIESVFRPWIRTLALYAAPLLLAQSTFAAGALESYQAIWNAPDIANPIRDNIEKFRKGDVFIDVVDARGKAVKNAEVVVRQQSHEFLFGCNLFALDQLATPELNARYEQGFSNLFNFATIPFYWRDLEMERGKARYAENSPAIWRRPPPDRLLKWCTNNGITPKGHALMYVKNMFMPDWTARDNGETLRKQGAEHMAEIAGRYGRSIPIWDVVNEEIPRMKHTNEWAVVPPDYLPWCFGEAARLLPKDSKLLLNDGTHEVHDNPAEYEALLAGLLRQKVRLDGAGIQFHIYNRAGVLAGKSLAPAKIAAVYERLGRLGLPLYITEITVPGNGEDGATLQAAITANLYRLWFSTPHMGGVTWWNLGDGTAFQEENKALGGLLDDQMRPKPAYQALDRLINGEWKTRLALVTDAQGKASFRGFHGRYSIRVTAGTLTREFPLQLKSGGPSRATFKLTQN